jgi:hypothetical protein
MHVPGHRPRGLCSKHNLNYPTVTHGGSLLETLLRTIRCNSMSYVCVCVCMYVMYELCRYVCMYLFIYLSLFCFAYLLCSLIYLFTTARQWSVSQSDPLIDRTLTTFEYRLHSGCVFPHQERTKCIYKCCDMETSYSWQSDF